MKLIALKDVCKINMGQSPNLNCFPSSRQLKKYKVAVQKALDETQTLFDSLMQEYFG